MNRIIQVLIIFLGSIFVALGILGIFLPLLPTTPFLLLGASCYIKGSPKLYNWLISNRLLGQYIRNYREGNGIPANTKRIAIMMLWVTIGSSVAFVVSNLVVRILLLLIALGVTWHILSIKDLKETIEADMAIEKEAEDYIECEDDNVEICEE